MCFMSLSSIVTKSVKTDIFPHMILESRDKVATDEDLKTVWGQKDKDKTEKQAQGVPPFCNALYHDHK